MSPRTLVAPSLRLGVRRLVLAAAVVAGCSGGASTTPARPSPTQPSVTPVAFRCEDGTTGCAGPLAPGLHRTARFAHPFAFKIPATGRWSNVIDGTFGYHFRVQEAPFAEFIVWSLAAPQAQGAACGDREREPGYGTTTAEWLRYLAEHEAVDILMKETYDLGGLTATRVEVGVKPSWMRLCPGNTDPFAFLVTDTGTPPTRGHGIGGTCCPASLTFVDVGGEAIVIWNDGGDAGLPAMLAFAVPVIKSFRFDTAP